MAGHTLCNGTGLATKMLLPNLAPKSPRVEIFHAADLGEKTVRPWKHPHRLKEHLGETAGLEDQGSCRYLISVVQTLLNIDFNHLKVVCLVLQLCWRQPRREVK